MTTPRVTVPVEPTEAMRLVPDRVLTETLYWMARAYERVHSMPRVSDTELANKIEAAKADLGRARDASPVLSNSAAPAPEGGAVRYGVYVASRASAPERPAMWRKLRDQGHPIVSTWIDEAGEGESHDLGDLWDRILREVTSAERLVLYAEADDFPLKGAYVEVGMALAASVPVFVVVPDVALDARSLRPLGSWAKHPLVTFCGTVEEAFAALATREEAPAPCKSCNGSGMDAGSRFNRCPDCCGEAPVEAVTLEARPEREDYLNPALRAQPPARPSTIAELHAAERLIDQQAAEIRRLKASEDAQPVARVSRKGNATGGLVWTDHGRASDLPDGAALFAAHLIEGRGEMKQEIYDNLCAADDQDIPLEDYPDRILSIVERYTHPAPDELRVAVEAFDPEDMRIVGDWIEAGEPKVSVPSGRIKALWQSARQALAALQAEQKGGA